MIQKAIRNRNFDSIIKSPRREFRREARPHRTILNRYWFPIPVRARAAIPPQTPSRAAAIPPQAPSRAAAGAGSSRAAAGAGRTTQVALWAVLQKPPPRNWQNLQSGEFVSGKELKPSTSLLAAALRSIGGFMSSSFGFAWWQLQKNLINICTEINSFWMIFHNFA